MAQERPIYDLVLLLERQVVDRVGAEVVERRPGALAHGGLVDPQQLRDLVVAPPLLEEELERGALVCVAVLKVDIVAIHAAPPKSSAT